MNKTSEEIRSTLTNKLYYVGLKSDWQDRYDIASYAPWTRYGYRQLNILLFKNRKQIKTWYKKAQITSSFEGKKMLRIYTHTNSIDSYWNTKNFNNRLRAFTFIRVPKNIVKDKFKIISLKKLEREY